MARFTGMGLGWRDGEDAAPQHGSINRAQYTGTRGDDHLHGRRTTDTIEGLGGDDVLKGSTGTDNLSGGAGDDILYGGTARQEGSSSGSDELDGGDGDDRLYGGYFGDGLTGGAGKDRFTYTALSDSPPDHSDTILDFKRGEDKLVFRDELRDAGTLHFIGDAAFSGTPGEVRYDDFSNPVQAVVELDADGDGAADLQIVFNTEIQFKASDFS